MGKAKITMSDFCKLVGKTEEEIKGGSLHLHGTNITELPDGLTVGGSLDLRDTNITELPTGLVVGCSLFLHGTNITELPTGLTVGGNLYLNGCTNITELPDGLTVGGSLDLRDTNITELPTGLTVGGNLDLEGCTGITSLPEGLTVGCSLYLEGCTGITELPTGLTVGDKVLTADKSYHDVECTMHHIADRIVYFKAQGMYEELKCTPNHPFYIRRKDTYYEKGVGKTRFLPAEYVKASEIKKGDKVGYPIFDGNDTSYSKAFWKLVGAWIADGWIDNNKRTSHISKGHRGSRVNSFNHKVIICCGKKNIARLHHIIQAAGYKYTLSEYESIFKCIICDKCLCEFLQDFGKYAHGKHLSPQCFMLDKERKKALLEGWFADGYKKSSGAQCVTTVSEKLALDMAQIARDVYLCPVSISRKTCNRICKIEGRVVNERPQYCVTISNSRRYGFYDDGFVWCNIKSIREELETNEVFNLSVNEEHSYNVYGIAVHNCQPYSLAGQRRGDSDNRALWPQMLRAIREIQPAWVVGENVFGILSMVQSGEAVKMGRTGDIFEENHLYREERQYTIDAICEDLERAGYSVQPFVIPACAVGAPHRRDRVWFIAGRDAADTDLDRLRKRQDEQEPIRKCEREAYFGNDGTNGIITDTHGNGGQDKTEWRREQAEKNDEQFESILGTNAITVTESSGSTGKYKHEQRKIQPDGQDSGIIQSPWADFPTQSPVCGRDDGLSSRLVGISFPKWRAESIKALGNAWVPQVAYEIFRFIEIYEKQIQCEDIKCMNVEW